MAGGEIARLFVTIGADTKEAMQGMQGLQQNMASVGQNVSKVGGSMTKNITLPMIAAGGAALAWANKMGNTADRILDLQSITGLSTGAIQEWQHVAKMAGVDTEAMTRITERLNREMTNIQAGTGKASEAVAALGLEADKLAGMTADQRLDALTTALAGVEDESERARIGSDLFGRQWEHVAPIVGMGADEMARLREEGKKYAMSDEELNKANDFRVAMEELKEEFGMAARNIGMELMPHLQGLVGLIKDKGVPFIQKIAEGIGKLVEWFGNLSPGVQKAIGVFMGLVVVAGPILMVVGKIITVISALMPLFGALKVAFLVLTGPIGLVVAAVAALIAIGIAVYKNWDAIKDFFGRVWETIKEIFTNALQTIINLFMQYHPIGIIISNWEEIKAFFGKVWEGIKEIFSNALQWIVDYVRGRFELAQNVINAVWGAIGKLFSSVWDSIKNIFQKSLEAITGYIQSRFEAASNMIKNIWNAIKDFMFSIWDNIKSGVTQRADALRQSVIDVITRALQWIRDLPRQAVQWGMDIIRGLINGIKNMAGALGGAIKGVAQKAVNSVKSFLGVKSPSKLFEDIGVNIGEGLEHGVAKMQDKVSSAINALAAPQMDGMGGQVALAGAGGATASGGGVTNTFHIENMNVRDDQDIEKIARQLYLLQGKRNRGVN